MEHLHGQTQAMHTRLNNVFHDFLGLASDQFIENRVYDEEVETEVPKVEPARPPDQAEQNTQREAELLPKVCTAVRLGLDVLDSAFERLPVSIGDEEDDYDEEEEKAMSEDKRGVVVGHRGTQLYPILEPKDLYLDRPLPHIIGSSAFLSSDDVGLGDDSSDDEGASSGSEADEMHNGTKSLTEDEDEGEATTGRERRCRVGQPVAPVALDGKDDESDKDLFVASDDNDDNGSHAWRDDPIEKAPVRPTYLFSDPQRDSSACKLFTHSLRLYNCIQWFLLSARSFSGFLPLAVQSRYICVNRDVRSSL
uniref:Uncharacterized protein n=1 Tax=Eptatretus burgeri TaxID=7764 RepID=A0A8C4QFN4_EPTBU